MRIERRRQINREGAKRGVLFLDDWEEVGEGGVSLKKVFDRGAGGGALLEHLQRAAVKRNQW